MKNTLYSNKLDNMFNNITSSNFNFSNINSLQNDLKNINNMYSTETKLVHKMGRSATFRKKIKKIDFNMSDAILGFMANQKIHSSHKNKTKQIKINNNDKNNNDNKHKKSSAYYKIMNKPILKKLNIDLKILQTDSNINNKTYTANDKIRLKSINSDGEDNRKSK
jgi:hypothetical protein